MPSTTELPRPTMASPSSIPDLRGRIPKLQSRKRPALPSNPLPVPSTPELPPTINPSNHTFVTPTRRIISAHDHEEFLSSPTYDLILAFIFGLTDSVVDTPISAISNGGQHPSIAILFSILSQVENCVHKSPPEDQGTSRFGNRGFRNFIDLLTKDHISWHSELHLPPPAITELSTYLLSSFGSRSRIDYGSGHELNFIMYLLCLARLCILPPSTFPALVLIIFPRYLSLMRLIQSTYYLEPAGSHGVWGLDDYQFLPFLFGSSQLLHHSHIRPLSIHQQFILEEYGQDYLYLNQIAHINSVKNVDGLRWHSPLLDDISAAKSWSKVLDGMKRMFVAEVLRKIPVMQHFLFGSLIPAMAGMNDENSYERKDSQELTPDDAVLQEGMKHVHQSSNWGECCGIKVPSSVAAAQERKRAGGGEVLRRLPFD